MKLKNIIFMIFVFCISVSLVNAEIIPNEEDKPNDSLEINNTLPDDNLQNSEIESNEKGIDNGIYIIYSKLNNFSGLHLNDNNIVLNVIKSSYNDAFRIEYKGNGNYQIKTYSNDLYLGVEGTNVTTMKDESYWHIKENKDGSYSFIHDDYYLDVSGGSTKDGTNIQVYASNNTDAQKFILNNYGSKKTYHGIDISKWQGNINWNELIKGNPNFIIMRIGRGYSESIKDTKFEEYYKKANDYDIPVGIYIYSLASNLNEANKEAELVLKWIDNKELDLPVFYDMEYSGQLYLGKEVLTKMADTFCSKIISNNYGCGIYANVYWLNNFLDGKMLSEKYPIWLAHWTGANDYSTATLDKYKSSYVLSPYQYWQFTDKGVYHGITENTVDLDFGYDIFD